MAINNIPRSFQFWNGIAATPADFNLDAGWYGLLLASGFTSAQLLKLLPDGTTYAAVSGAADTVAAYKVLILPAGQYRIALTATAFIGEIALISRGGNR